MGYRMANVDKSCHHVRSSCPFDSEYAVMRFVAFAGTALLTAFSMHIHAKEVAPPSYLTAENLDNYVAGIKARLPMTSADGITIKNIARSGRTLVYSMHARDDINQQVASLLANSSVFRAITCRQEAEAFMLKRKVNLTWNYFDRSNRFLGTIALTPADCGY